MNNLTTNRNRKLKLPPVPSRFFVPSPNLINPWHNIWLFASGVSVSTVMMEVMSRSAFSVSSCVIAILYPRLSYGPYGARKDDFPRNWIIHCNILDNYRLVARLGDGKFVRIKSSNNQRSIPFSLFDGNSLFCNVPIGIRANGKYFSSVRIFAKHRHSS